MDPLPEVDVEEVRTVLTAFLADTLDRTDREGYVVGLSGGLDSALAATLAAEAVGADRVLALKLPAGPTRKVDLDHADLVADALGIATETVDVRPVVDAVADGCDHAVTEHAAMNLQARARMVVLYAHANSQRRLVLGTGNKSELLLGYFTKFGDGAADVYPLGDVYKTRCYEVAEAVGVPEPIRDKAPSAGLRAGQRDADELGAPYEDLDRILAGLETGLDDETIVDRTGLDAGLVSRIRTRVHATEHKRSSLVVPKLGFRTPGLDWRAPRTGVGTGGG